MVTLEQRALVERWNVKQVHGGLNVTPIRPTIDRRIDMNVVTRPRMIQNGEHLHVGRSTSKDDMYMFVRLDGGEDVYVELPGVDRVYLSILYEYVNDLVKNTEWAKKKLLSNQDINAIYQYDISMVDQDILNEVKKRLTYGFYMCIKINDSGYTRVVFTYNYQDKSFSMR